jgi:hypothetical protein
VEETPVHNGERSSHELVCRPTSHSSSAEAVITRQLAGVIADIDDERHATGDEPKAGGTCRLVGVQ